MRRDVVISWADDIVVVLCHRYSPGARDNVDQMLHIVKREDSAIAGEREEEEEEEQSCVE